MPSMLLAIQHFSLSSTSRLDLCQLLSLTLKVFLFVLHYIFGFILLISCLLSVFICLGAVVLPPLRLTELPFKLTRLRSCPALAQGIGALRLLPLDQFQPQVVILLDKFDLVCEMVAFEVDFKEYSRKQSENDGHHQSAPEENEGLGCEVVEGDFVDREVEFSEDDQQIFREEEYSADDLDVEVELLGEGSDCEGVEQMDELQQKGQVHEEGTPGKNSDYEHCLYYLEQFVVAFVPGLQFDPLVPQPKHFELIALQVLLPLCRSHPRSGVQHHGAQIYQPNHDNQVEVDQYDPNIPYICD